MLLVKLIHINMDKIKRPKLYTLPDTLHALQRPAAVLICPVQRVQRPGVCACVRSAAGMVCLASRTAYVAACRARPFRVRWGLGLHRRGI